MPTKNPRVNITFEEATVGLLAELASRDHTSISSIAKDLVLEALELREDVALSAVAKIRDKEGAKRIKHTNVWK